ncbi:PREDICTED: guanine nucleotide-binding protein-like 1 isoform X1 [Priapulus caudatus]|uniref:Guanine nucleotide-binding protein-like 1 n=1 Tax=Priapulus caudatus TaxID=37621 RepID=A0ABM1E4B9_PRICU|nr:PREDICTED: guanine nucleotide-binding protein-like 1 isoform X1 [Priapulus caudatus]XP_014667041.1 PREDICTED: guanine nucleotide-binding protein-like 1 isoform X1 [Priapulus caudatus]
MPRKKAFSGKQKKRQLHEKREKKKCEVSEDDSDYPRPHTVPDRTRLDSIPDHQSSDAGESDTDTSETLSITDVRKLNQQPDDELTSRKRYDANRYRLHFQREPKHEIHRRKELAMRPFKPLSEIALEISLEDIYRPGTAVDMPKRPAWNYSMSKEKVEAQEERMFMAYLDKIYSDFKSEELSYFELNLETWRQLWRVLEISDIVLLITDIRFPALHFSPALYSYIIKELNKDVVLVLNKIDLAPASLVAAWKNYFQERFPKLHIICFSSYPKDPREQGMLDPNKVFHKKRVKTKKRFITIGPQDLYQACEGIVSGKVDLQGWKERIAEQMEFDDNDETHENEAIVQEDSLPDGTSDVRYKNGILTIGCVGHPNVGKSSLLNGLVGRKVVSVSKTPGHTKHYQTIFLTPTVRLCDSPGLTFPSVIEKPLQILSGIYPVAQVQEPYTAIGFLAQRIPLVSVLHLKPPDYVVSKPTSAAVEWTAIDICEAWAEKRNFKTAKAARNDVYRAANNLLRFAQEGRLRLCLRPPGFTKQKEMWERHADTRLIAARQNLNADRDSSDDLASTSDPFSSCSSDDDEADKADKSSSETEATGTERVRLTNPYALLTGDE